MRARTTMTGLALTAGLALSMAPAGLASAGAPSADRATTSVVSHKAATTKAEQQRVEDYWTPARMKNAIPVGVKVNPNKGKPGGSTGGTAVVGDPAAAVRQGVLHQRQLQLRLLRHGDQQHQRRRRHDRRTLRQRRRRVRHQLRLRAGVQQQRAALRHLDRARAAHHRPSGRTARTTTTTPAFAVMNENAAGQSLTEVTGGYTAAFNQPTRPDHEGLRLPGRAALQRPDAVLLQRRGRAGHLRRQPATRAWPAT